MKQAVAGLFESRKAVMVLVVFIGLCVLVAFGRVPVALLERFLDVVMPSWLIAHAGEQGAKALAEARAKQAAVPEG